MSAHKFWTLIVLGLFFSIVFFTLSFLYLKKPATPKPVPQQAVKQTPAPMNPEEPKPVQATVSSALAPKITQPGVLGLSKKSYKIAIFGDSMVDTMGESLEYLSKIMNQKYPGVSIEYFNYGIGAQNVEMGLNRFSEKFEYKTRKFPPLSEVKPDILIIASFAYNPFSPHNRDKHWVTLSKLLDSAKTVSPKVYVLAEIAPQGEGFGKGPNGVNWPEDVAYKHAVNIVEQINNAISLAKAKKLPLINAYSASAKSGKFGSGIYTNPDDGIHPSVYGHEFTADLIASKIKLE